MQADDRLAEDLFAGCSKAEIALAQDEAAKKKKEEEEQRKQEAAAAAAKPKIVIQDAFDQVELNVQADVEKLVETCLDKVNKAKAKDCALKMMVDLLKALEQSLTLKEINEIEKALADSVKDKKAAKGSIDAKQNKANTKLSKTTKFNTSSEWEEVYGGGAGDEEWTQEEWDDWEKKQAAAK